jgi:hypothetical protein
MTRSRACLPPYLQKWSANLNQAEGSVPDGVIGWQNLELVGGGHASKNLRTVPLMPFSDCDYQR